LERFISAPAPNSAPKGVGAPLGEDKGDGPRGILIASILHLIAAAYLIAMAMALDRAMFHLYALSALSIAAAAGLFRAWRWGLWASAISAPLMIALSTAALYYSSSMGGLAPDLAAIALHASLVGLAALSIAATGIALAKRELLK